MPVPSAADVHHLDHAQLDNAARLHQRLLWLGMAFSIFLYYALMEMVQPVRAEESPVLIQALVVAAIGLVAASFPIRNLVLSRLAASANLAQNQRTALLVALALCEAAAFCGLVAWFRTAWPYSYVLLLVGLGGQLAHYPGPAQP